MGVKWYLLIGSRRVDQEEIIKKYEVVYRPQDGFSLQDAVRRTRFFAPASCLVVRYELLTPEVVSKLASRSVRHAVLVLCETPEDLRSYVVKRCRRIYLDKIESSNNERVLEITQATRRVAENLTGPADITRKRKSSKSVLLSDGFLDKWWVTMRDADDYE